MCGQKPTDCFATAHSLPGAQEPPTTSTPPGLWQEAPWENVRLHSDAFTVVPSTDPRCRWPVRFYFLFHLSTPGGILSPQGPGRRCAVGHGRRLSDRRRSHREDRTGVGGWRMAAFAAIGNFVETSLPFESTSSRATGQQEGFFYRKGTEAQKYRVRDR